MEQSTAAVMQPRRSRMLQRGESAVAVIGVALAAILFCAVAASAWWVHHAEADAVAIARRQHLNTVGDLLSQNVETLLADRDLAGVRRLISETSVSQGLSQCRVVLSDGQIIAASEPLKVTTHQLPETWERSRLPNDAAADNETSTSLAAAFPINVAGRGEAELQLTVPVAQTAQWETPAGVGAIGAAAMVALLMTYRTMRSRIRVGGAIREALLAIESGETEPASLCVAEALGNEAKTWNNLIDEREKVRKSGVVERTRDALGSRGQGKGDLSAACDAMSHGLVLIDEKGRVSYANGAAAVFLRVKREEFVGSDIAQYLQVAPVLQSVQEIVSGSSRRRVVHDIERKDEGVGVLRFNIRPVRREDAASAMITIEDITQQRVAEEARHAFVAQATHELRTPLTNIRLYVETAIEDGESDPAMRSKCLNVINGETRRLERIVGEMLSVAEIEAGSFKVQNDDVRLETVFEDLQADYTAQAEDKKLTLTFNLPPKLPQVKGDRDKILMALHNLVGNALKYTPAGGNVKVNVSSEGKNLLVEVQDSGIGISPEDAARLFEKFYRAKDPRVGKITGTGLGLSIAREVVRLHGGDINVESQLNQGSTFTMTLPVISEAA